MKAEMIWQAANDEWEQIQKLVGETNPATVDAIMRSLKAKIPCLYGYDDQAPALIFKSDDSGMVALRFAWDDATSTFALALEVNVTLK